ncbi:hypothetical protein SPSYN_00162 [Sporotomaculum syntrophicum]|uniref:Uncharacterized protein n=1 Tax=Sporotomaculum syntrophicum TaxID=182264 RepID=A0A9D3B001_9FIRM|nr:hypothetical protein SPSYN_00162 [Sporotomaculum syntrophicum]
MAYPAIYRLKPSQACGGFCYYVLIFNICLEIKPFIYWIQRYFNFYSHSIVAGGFEVIS